MEIRKLSWMVGLGVMVGLSLLVVSCEGADELAETGERVAVRIHLQGIQNRQTEEFTRAGGLGERREIAQVSRVLDDGMLLEMSLEPDESAELRAQDLEVNKTFRVIALKSAGKTYVSHADFAVNSSGTAYSSTDLHVLLNTAHDFVCISYNNTSPLPALTCTVGQVLDDLDLPSDGSDLLYDRVENQSFTGVGDAELGFSLVHQLSKVSVVIDCTYNSWAIATPPANQIRVAPNYTSAKLSYATGAITPGTAATDDYFTTWTAGANNYTQSSEEHTVCGNGEAVSVVIPANALTIAGKSLPNVDAAITFPIVTDLVGGGHYLLRVKFRSAMFANSNIYWVTTSGDDGYLKFDPYIDPLSTAYNTTANREQQQKQGVLFKWGSLIGISAIGLINVRSIPWADIEPIYVPTSPTTGIRTTVGDAVSDGKWTGTSYLGIPYVASAPAPYGRDINGLATLGSADYTAYKGDICKYLSSGDYRMCTAIEFAMNFSAWDGFSVMPNSGSNASYTFVTTEDGQTLIPSPRGITRKVNDMWFPASGHRVGASSPPGQKAYVTASPYYWTGSASSATAPVGVAFFAGGILDVSDQPLSAFAVRCVKN
jgi:hypothetical protein